MLPISTNDWGKNFQSNLEYQPPLSLPRTANDLTKTPGNSPPVGPVDDLNQNMITDVRIEQAKTVQKVIHLISHFSFIKYIYIYKNIYFEASGPPDEQTST